MRLINKHISTFGRFFLVLFFIANSGFTVVLYHCSMTHRAMADESSGMTCCAGMACCTCASCEDLAGPQTPATHVVTVNQQCMTATIAGGNLVEPTIVAREFNGQQILKADLLPGAVYETGIGSGLSLAIRHLATTASNVSTPSVEKYVLNASFLI